MTRGSCSWVVSRCRSLQAAFGARAEVASVTEVSASSGRSLLLVSKDAVRPKAQVGNRRRLEEDRLRKQEAASGRHRGSWKSVEVHAKAEGSELDRVGGKGSSLRVASPARRRGVGGSASGQGKGRTGLSHVTEPVSIEEPS